MYNEIVGLPLSYRFLGKGLSYMETILIVIFILMIVYAILNTKDK